MTKQRIFGLDLIRATAILLVVLHHGFQLLSFHFIPLPDGVDIFFVLSGYLIGGIIIKSVNKTQLFTFSDLKIFWFRRWFRTLPAYWVTLMLNLILYFFIHFQGQSIKTTLKLVFLKEKLWEYFFFIQNLFEGMKSSFFSESWSLSVEEWFYLILPLLLIATLKSKLSTKNAILISILGLILLPMTGRYFLSDIHSSGNWLPARLLVIMRLDNIGLGVLISYFQYYKPQQWKNVASKKWIVPLGIIIFYGCFYLVFKGYNFLNSPTITNLLFYTLTSVGVMMVIPYLSTVMGTGSKFEQVITSISLYSYSIYLLNYSLVIGIIKILSPHPATIMGELFNYICYLIVTFSGAFLLYKYVELPFMKFRDEHFSGHTKTVGKSQIPENQIFVDSVLNSQSNSVILQSNFKNQYT